MSTDWSVALMAKRENNDNYRKKNTVSSTSHWHTWFVLSLKFILSRTHEKRIG